MSRHIGDILETDYENLQKLILVMQSAFKFPGWHAAIDYNALNQHKTLRFAYLLQERLQQQSTEYHSKIEHQPTF